MKKAIDGGHEEVGEPWGEQQLTSRFEALTQQAWVMMRKGKVYKNTVKKRLCILSDKNLETCIVRAALAGRSDL